MLSVWKNTTTAPSFPTLTENKHTGVLIIGGGITGLLTAYLFHRQGIPCIIAEKDKIINGPFGILKLLRYSASFVLSLLQLICVIEGWISYFLNFILKGISSILFFVAFISLIWWPLDMLCGLIWSSCDYLKHLIWNKGFTWEASVRRWINHFPQL